MGGTDLVETYYLEELDLETLDSLIEKGVCFDVISKNAILPTDSRDSEKDAFWGIRDTAARPIR